jgi:hypothetical protein
MAETLQHSAPPRNVGPSPHIDLVVAVVLGVLTAGSFVWQVRTAATHPTATETALFNTLQFILTVGMTWFSTRAVSRLEFEESLKKFAISAYRRIDDIERMVDRLRREVGEMISGAPKTEIGNLRIVEAIVIDTGQLVRSSISDWADVIGDELLAIERIKRLEHEKAILQGKDILHEKEQPRTDETSALLRAEVSEALKKIEAEIAKTQSMLPPRLQLVTEVEDPSRATRLRRVVQWLRDRYQTPEGLQFVVLTGPGYPTGRDPKSLTAGEQLRAEVTPNRSINALDKDGVLVGRVLNGSPGGYRDFVRALEACYGDAAVALEFVQIKREATDEDGHYVWLIMRVTSRMVSPDPSSSSPAADGSA